MNRLTAFGACILFCVFLGAAALGASPDVNLAALRLAPAVGAADTNYSFAVYADTNFPVFASYAKDQNVVIDFNVWDADLAGGGTIDSFVVDINYSTGAAGDANYAIVQDLNLSLANCDSNSAPDANRYTCHYGGWSIAGLGDYNVWLIVKLWDGNREDGGTSSDTNYYANATFRIDNNAPVRSNRLPTGWDANTSAAAFFLRVTTNERASCKWGPSDVNYDAMPSAFASDNNLDHNVNDTNWAIGRVTRFVHCRDVAGNTSSDANTIDFNHSFRQIVFSLPYAGYTLSRSDSNTLTIDFNVVDFNGMGTDGNANAGLEAVNDLNVLVRYYAANGSPAADTNVIADSNAIVTGVADTNMTCTDDGNTIRRRCTVSWNTSSVPDGNYRIDINAWSYRGPDQNAGRYDVSGQSAGFVLYRRVRTVSISTPSSTDYWNNTPQTLVFSVYDINGIGAGDSNTGLTPIKDMNFIIRYSPRAGAIDGNILYDRNALDLNQTDINWTCVRDTNTQRTCTVRWIPSAITGDGNYYFDVNAYSFASGSVGSNRRDTNATSPKIVVDRVIPTLSSSGPSGTLTSATVTLTISSNEAATCKYDTNSQKSFDQMGSTLGNAGGSGVHSTNLNLANGTYSYYYYCRDLADNNSGQAQVTFTVAASSSGGDSGGGGGGGGGGGDPSPPANNSTLVSARNIAAGATAELTVGNTGAHAFYKVKVKAAQAIALFTVDFLALSGKPAFIATDAAKSNERAYKFVQITTNTPSTQFDGPVKLEFRVPKSWIVANNINKQKARLVRWTGTNWQDLATTFLREDPEATGNAFFEAETPGFSVFSIVMETIPAEVPPQDGGGTGGDSGSAGGGGSNPGVSGENPGAGSGGEPVADENSDVNGGVMGLSLLSGLGSNGGIALAIGVLIVGVIGIGFYFFVLAPKKEGLANAGSGGLLAGEPKISKTEKPSFSLPALRIPFLDSSQKPQTGGLGADQGGLSILQSDFLSRDKVEKLRRDEEKSADGPIKWPEFLRKK